MLCGILGMKNRSILQLGTCLSISGFLYLPDVEMSLNVDKFKSVAAMKSEMSCDGSTATRTPLGMEDVHVI